MQGITNTVTTMRAHYFHSVRGFGAIEDNNHTQPMAKSGSNLPIPHRKLQFLLIHPLTLLIA